MQSFPLVLRLAGVWILYGVWASLSGWLLSVPGWLGKPGYAVASVPGLALLAMWWHWTRPADPRPHSPWTAVASFRRLFRWRHPRLPFLLVSLLILIGGIWHAPTNHDALTYRLPRLLYWLQEGKWYWLGSPDFRLDIAGAGAEWMSAPIMLLTGGDRLLFLLNFIPFLLLPGLFFLSATGLGISPRRARWWMWVMPLAYGVALQAGSIGNDTMGAALALASLAFAAWAPRGRPVSCLVISIVALALMTGIKVTALPVVLPVGAFWFWQAWRTVGPARLAGLASAASPVAIAVSFVPIALLCWRHTGAWNGNPDNRLGIEVGHPVAGLLGNGADFIQGAIAPPVFPGVGSVDRWMLARLEDNALYGWIQSHYPAFDFRFVHELPTEEAAGFGLGVLVLALIAAVHAWRHRNSPPRRRRPFLPGRAFAWLTLVAALAFLAKAGGDNTPRLILPFTPVILLAFALGLPAGTTAPSTRWIWLPALFLLPSLVLNPNRPLVPPGVLKSLPGVPSSIAGRLKTVYSVYSNRNDVLAPLRDKLPEDATVAFAGIGDRSPYSLFRPLGERRVLELDRENIGEFSWIVGSPEGVAMRTGMSPAEWAIQPFEPVHEVEIIDKVSVGPEIWTLWHRKP